MARLIIRKGASLYKEHDLAGADIVTIGRSKTNDIILPDPSRKVSRCHAALVRWQTSPDRCFVRDLSSLRSTRVEGIAVSQKELEDGDIIQIADYELVYDTQGAEQQQLNRLRVVSGRAASAGLDTSTQLLTISELMVESALPPERREVIEELLRRAARTNNLAELLEQMTPHIIRAAGGERGFTCLAAAGGGYREVASAGLRPQEQIQITHGDFLERLGRGEQILEDNVVMVPILRRQEMVGFFCVDRSPASGKFSEIDAAFVATLGRLAGTHVSDIRRGGQGSDSKEDEPVEWPMEMVGKSKAAAEVAQKVQQAARSEMNVLLVGESGTGKELVARALHRASANPGGPLIARNCAAVTESLAETEIFGYAPKSGIANADPQGAPGWFEMADGGTLFLDEVHSLTIPLQDKLLRVLQDKEVSRVHARLPKLVKVKVVAATDHDLEEAVVRGSFRKPLYYRFGAMIRLAPLRDRPADIPLLLHYFLDRCAVRIKTKCRSLSHRALQHLVEYSWPGNVRELENCIQDAVSRDRDREVLLSWDFPVLGKQKPRPEEEAGEGRSATPAPPAGAKTPRTMKEVEREQILEALESTKGNITQAQQLLGYKSRQGMLNRMDRYGIPRNYGDPDAA